jgi:hypothetical protein
MRWMLEHRIPKHGHRVSSCPKYGILHTFDPSGSSHVIRIERGYHFVDTCRSCIRRIFPACGLPCVAHEARSPLSPGMDHGMRHPPSHRSLLYWIMGINRISRRARKWQQSGRRLAGRDVFQVFPQNTLTPAFSPTLPTCASFAPCPTWLFPPAHYGKSPYAAP